IHQSLRGKFINQAKYAQEILKKNGMTSCDSIGTPMATKHLDADLSGTPVDQTKYRSKVGALMYLTASRPYIMHATCYCARYQAQPTEKHLTAVKRIFRYLKDTIHIGLWYPKDTGFELTAFSDLDHTGCLDSRKSTSGGIQFLGGDKLVSWSSKKQNCTSMSSAEAEYAAIAISCNPVQHSRTKHIDVRYHFIKEKVEKGIVELFFVGTEYQLADLFTKALPVERFQYLVRRLEFGESYEAPQDDVATEEEDDVKTRTTLLLALPDEHQLRFSKYKTAQELWDAILKTFGGNEATKKTKKNQLKQQYGNFKAEGSETLEQTFNKLQAIVSHIEFMDVEIEQDDLNQNSLTSLAPEWLMYTIV
nr:copia protein [Tanacetum cinerariifolium]